MKILLISKKLKYIIKDFLRNMMSMSFIKSLIKELSLSKETIRDSKWEAIQMKMVIIIKCIRSIVKIQIIQLIRMERIQYYMQHIEDHCFIYNFKVKMHQNLRKNGWVKRQYSVSKWKRRPCKLLMLGQMEIVYLELLRIKHMVMKNNTG